MSRPIVYDATHLVSRLNKIATSGMDRVDLAFARHLTARSRIACGAHYGFRNPHLFTPERVASLVDVFRRHVGEDVPSECDDRWLPLRAWLVGERQPDIRPVSSPQRPDGGRGLLRQIGSRIAHDRGCAIPEGAIYLNLAQHAFEHHLFFDWLRRRPDVLPTFLVHDLLPLDFPEFFPAGYEARFKRRAETIVRHAGAIITTTKIVAERIRAQFADCGGRDVPIHVQPLASPLAAQHAEPPDLSLAASNYFVLVSTLEPRKNHLLILHVWRELAKRNGRIPKLVLVGLRGWENAETAAVLERSRTIRTHVRAVAGLSSSALRQLIAHARALLMPSFAEGYGLPIVEALSLGTPVVASDIAVFHEVSQNRATFLSPIDGEGWKSVILEFADERSSRRPAALHSAEHFVKPEWNDYFKGIEAFLTNL